MKRIALFIFCLVTMCVATMKADNEKPIQVSQLPAAARQFIKTYFADRKVMLAKVESELLSKTYEVMFDNGASIDFDGKGNWQKVDCRTTAVPKQIIPSAIAEYVKAHYPDVVVVKIEKDRKEYEVKLSNRIELTFDLKFNLKDIDM